MSNNLWSGHASIDGSENGYPCFCNPEISWNGWAMPLFTWEVAGRIMEDLNIKPTEKISDGYLWCKLDDNEEAEPVMYKTHVAGLELWSFDGFCWDFDADDCLKCGQPKQEEWARLCDKCDNKKTHPLYRGEE